jgi:carbohydrate kinase (thermoresistant glucokinase family)
MGVSGCGKSTIGKLIASRYQVNFIDGDDLHPQGNITKMSQGIPLNDEDRKPWLETVARELNTMGEGVIACSALKKSYRSTILETAPKAIFIHLHGGEKILQSRLSKRSGHFMPSTLLSSQLSTLEELEPDEPGIVVEISRPEKAILREITDWIDAENAKLHS